MTQFSIEFELLLLSASYFSDKEKFCAFKETHQIDWQLFLSLLHRHRVLPMVCHNMHRWSIELPIKEKLKHESIKHATNALQQTALLLEIDKLFTANGIECIHFKGASLSYYLYNDTTLRQFKDIDILIERNNIDKATALLIKNNFKLKNHFFKKSYLNSKYQQHYKDYQFEKNNCEMELHWGLLDIFNQTNNALFFKNKTTIPFNQQSLQIFDESYYLSYLILHGHYSGWARLHWLIDIVDFIKTYPIDWQKIKMILEVTGYGNALDEVIELLWLYFSIEKPIAIKIPKKLIKTAGQLLQLPINTSSLSPSDIPMKYRKLILINNTVTKKYKSLLHLLGQSCEDWRILSLPKPLFFLYYPLRPILWVIRRVKS